MVHEVERARRSLDIAVYSMTQTGIAKAVADAHRRGVRARVVMDNSQSQGRYSSATYREGAGVPVWTDRAEGLMHNEFALVDGRTLITGSLNWTKGGEPCDRMPRTVRTLRSFFFLRTVDRTEQAGIQSP